MTQDCIIIIVPNGQHKNEKGKGSGAHTKVRRRISGSSYDQSWFLPRELFQQKLYYKSSQIFSIMERSSHRSKCRYPLCQVTFRKLWWHERLRRASQSPLHASTYPSPPPSPPSTALTIITIMWWWRHATHLPCVAKPSESVVRWDLDHHMWPST